MISDILQIIINYSKLKNQIICSHVNKYMYNNINIYFLEGMTTITQKTIEMPIFRKLKILRCMNNRYICDVNHLSDTLEDLDCSFFCGINQDGISQLKILKVLCCYGNKYILNVNHLADTLGDLNCRGSGIDQNGISQLKNLKKMECTDNTKINNVNHLSNSLEYLNCRFRSGMCQDGISQLKNLKILICDYNKNINSVNHLANTLEKLDCYSSGIDKCGIYQLKQFREL